MAIALDATSGGGTTFGTVSPLEWTHTCTGSDLLLLVGILNPGTASAPTASYNGVPMTDLVNGADSNNGYLTIFGLLNPATGANTVSVSFTGAGSYAYGGGISYTGVRQSELPDGTAANLNVANGTTITGTITTNSADAWIAAMSLGQSSLTISAGAGQTSRLTWTGNTGIMGGDSNAALTQGANTLTSNFNGTSNTSSMIMVSFADANVGGGFDLTSKYW